MKHDPPTLLPVRPLPIFQRRPIRYLLPLRGEAGGDRGDYLGGREDAMNLDRAVHELKDAADTVADAVEEAFPIGCEV